MANPLVVHIIDRLPPDGAERLLCELLRYRSAAFDYHVLCLVEGGEFEALIRDMGVPITILGKKPGIDVAMLRNLWRWLRIMQPAVVHTHLFTADTWGRLAARLASVPAIFSTVHSVNSWQGIHHRLVDRVLSVLTTKLIACTDQVAEKLVHRDGVPASKVVTLANAVDLQRFDDVRAENIAPFFTAPFGAAPDFTTSSQTEGLPAAALSSPPVVAVLGRLEAVKGQGYLLKCLSILQRENVPFRCLFIGDGPDRGALEAQVDELSLRSVVAFAGFRRDVPELLSAIDILVIPSQWEGLPMALLEAMALSRAVVAHDVGGIADVMRDENEGLLVRLGDTDQMVESLRRVLESKALRERLGANAQQRVRTTYSAEKLSADYESLYREALGQHFPAQEKE